ncbi:MAG: acyl-(acyl-carrier-protein)--UDP-N-acetylglucosamine O-acyltransferase [Verrucomicrobiales bacterium]|nr:acyl-(acyl-carrier-protein)--UDP-N-acetylglucosamine O-acyltransferase [Verrucomicrobiales bacterium]
MPIHPTAIIHPGAILGRDNIIGPYCVVDANVTLGDGNWLGPFVHLTGHTEIGSGNRFHSGSVIGDAPQDLKYKDEPTRVRIGDSNQFREHVTIHRSNKLSDDTVVGSHNYLMANAHLGHNVKLGNHVIIANGALLAGHVEVADRVFISGNCLVHQFTRLGTLSLMQGGSGIGMDLPPYTISQGVNQICGLNIIGLRRAGIPPQERLELKKLYRLLFRSGLNLREALKKAAGEFKSEPANIFINFVGRTGRGVCRDVSSVRKDKETNEDAASPVD